MRSQQLHLPALAPEVISLRAIHEGAQGWGVMIQVRHQLEEWKDVPREVYMGLTPGELVDVCYASMWCALGRPDDGL